MGILEPPTVLGELEAPTDFNRPLLKAPKTQMASECGWRQRVIGLGFVFVLRFIAVPPAKCRYVLVADAEAEDPP